MDLRNTRTERNLQNAFFGESIARNKYLFFAEKARQEGRDDIAQMFEALSINEGAHAELFYRYVFGIGDSAANLHIAMDGERNEWSSIYPRFADIAENEGFHEIAEIFRGVARIERDHDFRFRSALTDLVDEQQGMSEKALLDQTTEVVEGYRCIHCGAVFETCPSECDLCHTRNCFEKTTFRRPRT